MSVKREAGANGNVTISDAKCRFEFSRRGAGVLEVRIELTVAIAKHLSETGNLIQIYSDPSLFEARKAR